MRVLILTDGPARENRLVGELEVLGHDVAAKPLATADASGALRSGPADLVLVDAGTSLGAAAAACRANAASDQPLPLIVAVSEGSLAALKNTWGFDDWVLRNAQAAEIETRMRLTVERTTDSRPRPSSSVGDLVIDEETYIVRLRGRMLDLTYREFELLKYLAEHPGRVFTRGQLLQEVWGYDYFGGTRTVDVHIRRLRAKLGAEHEQLIGTVRGVGYKLDPQGASSSRERQPHGGEPSPDAAGPGHADGHDSGPSADETPSGALTTPTAQSTARTTSA